MASVIELKVIKTKKINYESVYKNLESHQVLYLNNIKILWWEAFIVWYHTYTSTFYFYLFKLSDDI